MEGYMKQEGTEETRLELRLAPPGGHDAARTGGFQSKNSSPQNTIIIDHTSKKRAGQPVGWPPVRTSRKNIGTSSNSGKAASLPEKAPKDDEKSMFVKINMDGVPIGRKVDLKAYHNYQRLSAAVDQLFRGLLAAQEDASFGLIKKETEAIDGLLDGNGEYTLVYEDNEGDWILVGDVPWDMFISSAKRLRVLKRSDLSIFDGRNR